MAKIGQVYGIGQALLPMLPPPTPFQNAPTSNQDNYSVGQIAFTPGPNASNFYIYAGAGVWENLLGSGVSSVVGTTNQVVVNTVSGTATVSLSPTMIAPGTLEVTSNFTADSGVLVTTGNVTIVSGGLTLVAPGAKINLSPGPNASIGTSLALSSGTITVSTTAVGPSSLIFLTRAVAGGTLGNLSIGTKTPGVSFTITSDNAADTSTVNWIIFN